MTTRERFLKLIDRPRVPLRPESQHAKADPGTGIEQHNFSFFAEAGQRVPGVLLKSMAVKPKAPAIIVLHGTGGSKESNRPLLENLASKGFVAIAIDGRYHGQRSQLGKGSNDYVQAMWQRYQSGRGALPFLYDTVWDILRLIDYLETRPDIDATRIGAIGFSKGGMELYLAAAVDDRIKVSVPCIGVQSFRWAIENNAWQSRVGTFQVAVDRAAEKLGKPEVDAAVVRTFYDRVAPGVYSDFDGPQMLPLIAPRPLLVINGDSDARTPRPGLMQCIHAAAAAYKSKGKEDHFQFLLQPNTAHKVNPDSLEAAVAWFERWLK